MKIIRQFFLLALLIPTLLLAKDLFQKEEAQLKGRLRHLTLNQNQIVVMERSGTYPHWVGTLSFWMIENEKLINLKEQVLPDDTIFYGFFESQLVLVRTHEIELYRSEKEKVTYKIDTYPTALGGTATPFNPEMGGDVAIPTVQGVKFFKLNSKGFKLIPDRSLPPRSFYASELGLQPLDLQFWARGSFWLPSMVFSKKSGSVISPWMDEIVDTQNLEHPLYLNLLTEEDRDDGKSTVILTPTDLNGDGSIDLVVNKFKGSATQMQGETFLYISNADGVLPSKGVQVKTEGNRDGGAVPIDLNKDGKKDLIVASMKFNTWALIKAFLRKEVDLTFSFYLQKPNGFDLDHPDLVKEMSFQFDLQEGEIGGMLPTVEGDFNGDGYPDVVYAENRKGLKVILQHPKEKEFFQIANSQSYPTPVSRLMRVGDFNGDQRSDLVLYDSRSGNNRSFTVLLSQISDMKSLQ